VKNAILVPILSVSVLVACGASVADGAGPAIQVTAPTVDPTPGGAGVPQVLFTTVPPRGTWPAVVTGQALHVLPSAHRVATYIHTRNGWWSKPFWSQPLVTLDAEGRFSVLITTGGIDETADTVVVLPGAGRVLGHRSPTGTPPSPGTSRRRPWPRRPQSARPHGESPRGALLVRDACAGRADITPPGANRG